MFEGIQCKRERQVLKDCIYFEWFQIKHSICTVFCSWQQGSVVTEVQQHTRVSFSHRIVRSSGRTTEHTGAPSPVRHRTVRARRPALNPQCEAPEWAAGGKARACVSDERGNNDLDGSLEILEPLKSQFTKHVHICYPHELSEHSPLIVREVCSGWIVGRGRQNNNTFLRSPLQILQKLLQTNAPLLVIPVIILTDVLDPCCLENIRQRVCRQDGEKTTCFVPRRELFFKDQCCFKTQRIRCYCTVPLRRTDSMVNC